MPTLYDNFERVRQYIDQHQADVDLSSYVSKDELSGCGYLTAVPSDYPTYAAISEMGYVTNEVTQLDGPLFISYQTANNAQYTLNAYSHIVAGTEDKTGVSLVATKRKCGGAEGTSYMASFFTNSDGRSKFAHKTKISATEVGGHADDAFMCFNAYGFRIAYSGTEGVAASTEYEILHEGNIGNLGYITADDVAAMGYVTSSDLPVIDENIIPKETSTYTLGDLDHLYANTYTRRINSTNDGLNIFLNNSNKFAFQTTAFKTNVDNVNLGTSANKWAATYTANLYADTIHNFIWTGTSAEYAALDNYTSYQIYLIQEA